MTLLVKKINNHESIKCACILWMKIMTMSSGALYLLHHYKINFAHPLEFKNLVTEFLNAKIRANNNNKMNYHIYS